MRDGPETAGEDPVLLFQMQIITIHKAADAQLTPFRARSSGTVSQWINFAFACLVVHQPTPSFLTPRAGSIVAEDDGVRRIDVRELLGDRREVLIVHAGREYRLRLTSNGKLILTA